MQAFKKYHMITELNTEKTDAKAVTQLEYFTERGKNKLISDIFNLIHFNSPIYRN